MAPYPQSSWLAALHDPGLPTPKLMAGCTHSLLLPALLPAALRLTAFQVRFELSFAALDPSLTPVVPWRDPAFFNRFRGRSDLLAYAESKGLPVVQVR